MNDMARLTLPFPKIARRALGLAALGLAVASSGCAITQDTFDRSYDGPEQLPAEHAAVYAYTPEPGGPQVEMDPIERGEGFERSICRFRVAAPAISTETRLWRDLAAERAGADGPGAVSFAPDTAGEGESGAGESRRAELGVPPGRSEDEMEVLFEYYRSTTAGEGPRPALLITPILGGHYTLSRYIARYYASKGYHCAMVLRDEPVLAPHWELDDLRRFMKRSVVGRRHVLDWMQRRPEIDPERIGAFGVSLGSLVNVVLAAVEPDRIKRSVLVMCAGDVPRILRVADEGTVRRWRAAWLERHGASPEQLEAEARRVLPVGPLELAPHVDADRVIIFGSRYDAVLPIELQDQLRDAIGRPGRFVVPTGHYTAALFLPFIRERAERFLDAGLK